jgi:hypothetical protein
MDLGGWLRSLGLEQYEAAFRDNVIDHTVPSLPARYRSRRSNRPFTTTPRLRALLLHLRREPDGGLIVPGHLPCGHRAPIIDWEE